MRSVIGPSAPTQRGTGPGGRLGPLESSRLSSHERITLGGRRFGELAMRRCRPPREVVGCRPFQEENGQLSATLKGGHSVSGPSLALPEYKPRGQRSPGEFRCGRMLKATFIVQHPRTVVYGSRRFRTSRQRCAFTHFVRSAERYARASGPAAARLGTSRRPWRISRRSWTMIDDTRSSPRSIRT
jgi:hypothetical protein